jgi:predicted RNA polymerase sigma factor
VPSAEDLPARVSGVLAVLFLVFNEGYLATGPDTDPVRHDLTAEAIRLTRLIRALISVRRFVSSFGRCLVRRLSLHSGYGAWPCSA